MAALDGTPIHVLGAVDIILKRTHDPMLLPCIRVRDFVVNGLSDVNADVPVGNDVVAGSGGLSLHNSDDGDLMHVSFGGCDDGSYDLLASSGVDRVTELEKKLGLSEQQLSEPFLANCLTWKRDRQTWRVRWRRKPSWSKQKR